MKKILEINDEDVGEELQNADYRPKTKARALVFKDDKIALLYIDKAKHHILPGGGIKDGESIKDALHRELLEETGCTVTIEREVGEIVEHRSHEGTVNTNHCFIAKVVEEGEPDFTEHEKQDGFQLQWVTPKEAISLLRNIKSENYKSKFILKRDCMFIEEAIRNKEL